MQDIPATVAAGLDEEQWETLTTIASLDHDLWTLERIYAAVAGALELSHEASRKRVEDVAIPALRVFSLELESAETK